MELLGEAEHLLDDTHFASCGVTRAVFASEIAHIRGGDGVQFTFMDGEPKTSASASFLENGEIKGFMNLASKPGLNGAHRHFMALLPHVLPVWIKHLRAKKTNRVVVVQFGGPERALIYKFLSALDHDLLCDPVFSRRVHFLDLCVPLADDDI